MEELDTIFWSSSSDRFIRGVTLDVSTRHGFLSSYSFPLCGKNRRISFNSQLLFCARPNLPKMQSVRRKLVLEVLKAGIKRAVLCTEMAICASDTCGVVHWDGNVCQWQLCTEMAMCASDTCGVLHWDGDVCQWHLRSDLFSFPRAAVAVMRQENIAGPSRLIG
jgi:hypothetical protein